MKTDVTKEVKTKKAAFIYMQAYGLQSALSTYPEYADFLNENQDKTLSQIENVLNGIEIEDVRVLAQIKMTAIATKELEGINTALETYPALQSFLKENEHKSYAEVELMLWDELYS